MSDLVDIAEFSSESFSPFLPDDAQVNPMVYGAELAFWLSRALAEAGVVTSYPESEDWGWYVLYVTEEESEFAVHCGNIGGSPTRWLLSLRRFGRKLFGRDKPPHAHAAGLVAAIHQCLEANPTIRDISWLYPDSQNP